MYGTESADDGRGRSMDSTDIQSAGRDGVDHISDLSDDLLLHVLRFLPDARDLARTSALSRRWRHLWTSAPVLRLCAPQYGSNSTKPEPDEDARFNAFVHNVLARRAYIDASVDTLELRSWRWPGELLADVWLRRAMRLTVDSLYYSVRTPRRKLMSKHLADKLRPRLRLPGSMRAVTMSLGLNNAALLLPRTVDFHAITDLTLAGMVFLDDNGDRLGSLLSSSCCPRLRKLKLTYLSGLEELQLNGRALEMLHLRDLWDLRRFHVNAPLLSSLRVDGYFMLHRCHEPTSSFTIRAPALETVESYLTLGLHQLELQRHTIQILQECRPDVRHILWLTVPEMLDDVLTVTDIPELPGVRNLTVRYWSQNSHYVGQTVTGLLGRCSNLQYLHLDNGCQPCGPVCEEGCSTCDLGGSWNDDVLTLQHLQEVELGGFTGQEYILDMVQLLLASAPALERMLVSTNSSIKGLRRPAMVIESLESRLPRGKGKWTARLGANAPAPEYEWAPDSST